MGKGECKVIKLEHVEKYFGDLHVLKDVNLEVAEGEKLVIIGPSGSGKSTTVRCMNFLEEPTSGHVYIDGQELTSKNKTKLVRETTSMVFQQFNLYPHMTVLKNLTLAPMKLHHKTKQEAEELAYHYLEVVGLRDKANVYPTQLSGGCFSEYSLVVISHFLENTCLFLLLLLKSLLAVDPHLDVPYSIPKNFVSFDFSIISWPHIANSDSHPNFL